MCSSTLEVHPGLGQLRPTHGVVRGSDVQSGHLSANEYDVMPPGLTVTSELQSSLKSLLCTQTLDKRRRYLTTAEGSSQSSPSLKVHEAEKNKHRARGDGPLLSR